jgi:hypothetical protein
VFVLEEQKKSIFSAEASLLGYLFQCRYALLECVKRLGEEEEFLTSIENLDDIEFKSGEAVEVLQTKHSINKIANLTDASTDLWKTIRIWCEGIISGDLSIGSKFFLVTTNTAKQGSAAYYLKPEKTSRDISKSIDRLNATVFSSTNRENFKAYESFNQLNDEQKAGLFENVFIIDGAPQINDIDTEIHKILWSVAKEKNFDSFLRRLEGWWLKRVIDHLTVNDTISSQEIRGKIDILREKFKEDDLPIDPDILDFVIEESEYEDKTFVKQLKLIKVSNRRIFWAITNYYRAFEQRSRWVIEELILPDELERYEDQLIEEWEICFERMKEKIGEDAAEEVKEKCAQSLYGWVETKLNRHIRPNVTHPFVMKGSYHMLSDDERIGWHPDFKERLLNLIK